MNRKLIIIAFTTVYQKIIIIENKKSNSLIVSFVDKIIDIMLAIVFDGKKKSAKIAH